MAGACASNPMVFFVEYLRSEGLDTDSLDETIAQYVLELMQEGGMEEEAWSVLEGCFPELEESSNSKEAFRQLLPLIRQYASQNSITGGEGENTATDSYAGNVDTAQRRAGTNKHENANDLAFLKEMVPQVSDQGLRYALVHEAKGSRTTAAGFLADLCTQSGARREQLEAAAKAWERQTREETRRLKEATSRAARERQRDRDERGAMKDSIVKRYADEAVGVQLKVAMPTPSHDTRTRYRDGKIVTTTGAKVIVENLRPEWDGGSRGKVKTKGKRGKGFV